MYEIHHDCVFLDCGPNKCKRTHKKCKFVTPEACEIALPKEVDASVPPVREDEFFSTAFNSAIYILSGLFRIYQKELNYDTKRRIEHEKRGHWPFIARNTHQIFSMLIPIRNYFKKKNNYQRSIKFLDCGCGIGNVVLIAKYLGFDAHGIEYDKKTLDYGRKLFRQLDQDPTRLFQGDLLEYDGFDRYDVLYLYCPMSRSIKEHEFEDRLVHNAKVGAVITGARFNPYNQTPDGKEIIIIQKLQKLVFDENMMGEDVYIKSHHFKL